MFNSLDKFKNSFDKLSANEKEELKAIHSQTEKLLVKNRFDEALDYLKSKLNEFKNVSGQIFIEGIKSEIVKAYNEYIINDNFFPVKESYFILFPSISYNSTL